MGDVNSMQYAVCSMLLARVPLSTEWVGLEELECNHHPPPTLDNLESTSRYLDEYLTGDWL